MSDMPHLAQVAIDQRPVFPGDVMPDLVALCQRFHVSSLDVFGSAETSRFDPCRSDIDFVVEFSPLPSSGRADAYFGLHDALQTLFKRDVDLITEQSIKNPYLRRSIDQTRHRIFSQT